MGAHVKQHGL